LKRILFVDDEVRILDGLRRMLRSKIVDWDCHYCTSANEAMALLEASCFDAVVSDLNMPGRSGLDLLRDIRSSEIHGRLPFLMLTGNGELSKRHEALQMGATDFLSKPTDFVELTARLTNVIAIRDYQEEVERANQLLEERVKERTRILEQTRHEIVLRLAMACETRDTDTGRHILRVGSFCRLLALEIGCDEEYAETLLLASTLHDVGKIGIADSVLLKPGRLTEEERLLMQAHCLIGYRILSADGPEQLAETVKVRPERNEILQMATRIARWHHERWDGDGYPDGISGADIPLEARIVAIADVYDALRSPRPYKEAFTEEKTAEIIMGASGTQFEPALIDAFVRRRVDMDELYLRLADDVEEISIAA
jgi:response regulator RpfG family c-di-GMP phosphodiesterase